MTTTAYPHIETRAGVVFVVGTKTEMDADMASRLFKADQIAASQPASAIRAMGQLP